MRAVRTIAGSIIALLIFTKCQVQAQPIRFSEHYDLNNGAGGFLSGIHLGNDTLLVVGYSLNLSTNSGYDEGHHIVIGSEGELIHEHQLSAQQISYKTNNIIRSSYSDAIFSAGSHCDYNVPSPGYCDFYFARLDETGDTLFTKVLARPDTSDLLLSMVETRPNKIMLIGWTYDDTTDTNADILLITVDTLGNEVNRVVYGGGGTDYIHSGIVINEDGEVLMTGYTASFAGSDNDTWLIKTDSIGNVIWHQTYNHLSSSGGDAASSVSRSNDGNFFLAGGAENSSSGNSDGVLMKITPDGDPVWTKKYIPNSGSQSFWSVQVLPNGDIVAVGQTTNTDDGSQAGWLVKTDANGDTLWTRTYNPSDATDLLRNMLVMPNGDIVMVGFGRGENSTTQDGWILRVDSMGCLVEGCFSVGIDDRTIDDERFAIFPNPAENILNIVSEQAMEEVRLYDMQGRTVSSFILLRQQTLELDVSGLNAGLFILEVLDTEGIRNVRKVIVERP